jgi:hypothetical protein
MRLWSLHPKYLDARGLVAAWREALLAQAVLRGQTRGYTRHPQLLRFRESASPVASISAYLAGLYEEAVQRGYAFDRRKVGRVRRGIQLTATSGQLRHEWRHLKGKLTIRDREWLKQLGRVGTPDAHPLFRVVVGEVAPWEVTLGRRRTRR